MGRNSVLKIVNISDYRREFSAENGKSKSRHESDHGHSESLLEINTNLNKETHFTSNRSTIDILKGTQHSNLTPKLMHYDSAVPSPFLDKKTVPNTPQLKPRALSPSNSEEHQYDIPFSHLRRSEELPQPRSHQLQRKSRTSNRTSSGTSHGNSPMNMND